MDQTEKNQQLSQELIGKFVQAAHSNDLEKVVALHQQHPDLLNSRWEKQNETALEAAAHMGHRQTGEYLLLAGAPMTICAASMLGLTDSVAALLQADPQAICAESHLGFQDWISAHCLFFNLEIDIIWLKSFQ